MRAVAGRRVVLATLVASLVLAVAGLVAAPAQARWTDADGAGISHDVCRRATPSGHGWQFVSRVRKPDAVVQARAGVDLRRGDRPRARWRTGWLKDEDVVRGTVRIPRSPDVRLRVWQEGGDPDSAIGTAFELTVYRPADIRHC